MQQAHPYVKHAYLEELLPPKRILFLVNPKAGARAQRRIAEALDANLDHRQFIYTVWQTERPGHATELAHQAREEGYDIVVPVGGDGSAHEVAAALLHTDTVMGILPAGSGNGLATHLGYGRRLERAIRLLNTAEVHTIDCGMVNGRPFVNISGVGYDGAVAERMKNSPRRGFWPYLYHSVFGGLAYRPVRCTVEAEGRCWEDVFFVVSVANGPMYGYYFQIAPDARLDDGIFSVVMFKNVPRWRYFLAIPSSLNGQLYKERFVLHFQAKQVKVSCEQPTFAHADGESLGKGDCFQFEMAPKALKMLVPTRR
ncbi:MAG: diacylglycerol kinase family lipid kinase [Saprospiraceae bacterium]|nr:diacylglycerol kinase family lipid kinase [Saprospiraceae bacterium]MDW8228709.1 diacylglycerol kinase family lipid kinase [Saprospiraceae bacterium]